MIKRLLAVLAIAAVILGLAAAPAQAAHGSCPTAICVWDTTNFSGNPMYYWSNPPNGCTNFGAAINDKTRAAKNNITWVATFYTDANCTGQTVVTLSAFGSAGKYRNCNNSLGDGNAWWNSSASGCSLVPNFARISSVWVA